MRRTAIALAVIMLTLRPAAAFVTEEEAFFPAAGAEAKTVSVLSTTDTDVLRPAIEAFQAVHPDTAVRYVVASSQEVYAALADDRAAFDLVISSAMDLQMKLANDGFAATYTSPQTSRLPAWARWRDQVFAFAQESVVLIASRRGFKGLVIPQTRRDLTELLRDHPDVFRGRIGTYDPRASGAGYLFATQEARQSDSFWRLAEVAGSLSPRLYSSSLDMISDLKSGRLALAYNVLGSYAGPRLESDADGVVVEFADFTLTLLRTGFIPADAINPEAGGAFLDFLLSTRGQALIRDRAGLPPIDEAALSSRPHLRPIRLDAGLLVYLDRLKRKAFLEEWSSAMSQD
ncbi:ABC transporter substrate-binding protein [Defluviimonas sp. WL0002]|uniref:ABC transporter substrate-binding protein n=1 Tax=Albidovulum marisflavi TaxID=2984159 RepID=A0ABT2Z825_9RHOB|nr:ABC transporter substrate-binding protein [Defluviimonas sp. WL0002]MCV2867282.1 ABC transporter substrate-binding protein [Defluviimonas sp. WL0002]